jgi:hypothetical protein
LVIVVVPGERVEVMLRAGVGPVLSGVERCPRCGGPLGRWGSYRRLVRWGGRIGWLRVGRCRCRGCGVTHALLPAFLVARRVDLASAIGAALAMAAMGRGHRPIAVAAGVPETTARGWLRRLRARAAWLRALFARLAWELGGQTARAPPPGGVLAWLLDAITAAHRAAEKRLGAGVAECVWSFSSATSGGMWLSNTDVP